MSPSDWIQLVATLGSALGVILTAVYLFGRWTMQYRHLVKQSEENRSGIEEHEKECADAKLQLQERLGRGSARIKSLENTVSNNHRELREDIRMLRADIRGG